MHAFFYYKNKIGLGNAKLHQGKIYKRKKKGSKAKVKMKKSRKEIRSYSNYTGCDDISLFYIY